MTKDSKQNSQNIQSEIQRAILGADMKLLKSVMDVENDGRKKLLKKVLSEDLFELNGDNITLKQFFFEVGGILNDSDTKSTILEKGLPLYQDPSVKESRKEMLKYLVVNFSDIFDKDDILQILSDKILDFDIEFMKRFSPELIREVLNSSSISYDGFSVTSLLNLVAGKKLGSVLGSDNKQEMVSNNRNGKREEILNFLCDEGHITQEVLSNAVYILFNCNNAIWSDYDKERSRVCYKASC